MEVQFKTTKEDEIVTTSSALRTLLYVMRSLFILGLLFLFLKIEIENVFQSVLYQYYFLGIFIIAAIILFSCFVIVDIYIFFKTKNRFRLVFSFIGILIIGAGLLIRSWSFNRQFEKSQYKAYVELKGLKNEDSYKILFRKNGHVLIEVDTEDGLISDYYGDYVRENNLFVIDYVFFRKWRYSKFKLENNYLIPINLKNKSSPIKFNFVQY